MPCFDVLFLSLLESTCINDGCTDRILSVLEEAHNILIVENVINPYEAVGPNAEPKGEYQCNSINKSRPLRLPFIFQHILSPQE